MPRLRERERHPSARGLHSQHLAEELKRKGGAWRRLGNEKSHGGLGVASGQDTKTNHRATIGSQETRKAADRASHTRVPRCDSNTSHASAGPGEARPWTARSNSFARSWWHA